MAFQVTGAFFALVRRLLELDWQDVVNKNLMLLSLSYLDSSNRFICQSAADVLLLSSKEEAFGELSLQKALIPKVISLVRRKEPLV